MIIHAERLPEFITFDNGKYQVVRRTTTKAHALDITEKLRTKGIRGKVIALRYPFPNVNIRKSGSKEYEEYGIYIHSQDWKKFMLLSFKDPYFMDSGF